MQPPLQKLDDCADHLATEPLPRNANGKFLKRELREKLGTMAAA